MDTRTAHAAIRFGLGRRAGDAEPRDPVGWLAGQLDGPDPLLATPAPSVQDGLELLRQDRRDSSMNGAAPIRRVGAMFVAESGAIAHNLLNTAVPFRERLVWFWANHFTVSLRAGGEIQAMLPSYVREAIRPHVNGRFADMLAAAMHHPGMLMYLDNIVSIGPNSRIGQLQHRGLNENLARESLELHTVTPAAGYTQQDVIEYAKILTGWMYELPDQLYYMATPKIFRRQEAVFSAANFQEFLTFYVTGFADLCNELRARSSSEMSVFYPSSVSIDDRPANMTEYTMAKAAGEVLCADMTSFGRWQRLLVRRLPRLPTDQTATLFDADDADPVETMLPIVREMRVTP
ncbi:MAG: DUF1800 family protein [Rhodospirillales bacterium]